MFVRLWKSRALQWSALLKAQDLAQSRICISVLKMTA
nr:MAG TPA: hypothetical protein [Siphoviridae sp. cthBp9]